MTENKKIRPNPVNHAMAMGLEMGIWIAAIFILQAQQLNHPSLGLLAWLVTFYLIFGIYRATQHYKYTVCQGKISIGGAYSYIMWLFLFSSIVAALIRFVYLQWIDTSYLPQVYEQSMLVMESLAENGTELSAEELLDNMQKLLNPIRFSVLFMMFDVFMGALLAIVVAPIVALVNTRIKYPSSRNHDDDSFQDKQ